MGDPAARIYHRGTITMQIKFIFTLLASTAIFASCASKDLIVFDGKVDIFSPYVVSPKEALSNAYAAIISEDGKRYNIWPKTLEERLRNNQSIKVCSIRFTVRPCGDIGGYGLKSMDGAVAPLSWEILDSKGEVIKNHYLRKSRWKTWNRANLDPWADVLQMMPKPLGNKFQNFSCRFPASKFSP
jgi:hypothetical protein